MAKIIPDINLEQQVTEAGDRLGGLRHAQVKKREALEPAFKDKAGKQKGPFRRGDKLRPEMSFAPALGDWAPQGKYALKELVPMNMQAKLDDALKHAGSMCLMETVDGVRELIEYDADEAQVREVLGDK